MALRGGVRARNVQGMLLSQLGRCRHLASARGLQAGSLDLRQPARPGTRLVAARSTRKRDRGTAAGGNARSCITKRRRLSGRRSRRGAAPLSDADVTGKCHSRPVNNPGETRKYDGPIPATSEYPLIVAAGARTRGLTSGGTQTANSPLSEDEFMASVSTFAGRLPACGCHHRRPVAGKVCVGRQQGRRGE